MVKLARLIWMLPSVALVSRGLAEQVDNPTYQAWASFKAGTIVHLQSTTSVPGTNDAQGRITETLVDVKPESVTIEITTEISAEGKPNKSDKQTLVIKARMEKGDDDPKPPFENMSGKLIDTKDVQETLAIGGRKYDTTRHDQSTLFTATAAAPADGIAAQLKSVTMSSKKWTSTRVPGGMVKSESASIIGGKEAAKMVLILVDYSSAQ